MAVAVRDAPADGQHSDRPHPGNRHRLSAQRACVRNSHLGRSRLHCAGPDRASMVPAGFLADDVDACDRGCDHAHACAADHVGAAMKSAFAPIWTSNTAGATPKPRWILALAVASIAVWQVVEHLVSNSPHPKAEQLYAAARLSKNAQAQIVEAKQKLGLLQPADVDPNRTGLIGPDWSETTTTIGEVQAKRTTTNPDLAAAVARI